MKGKLFFLAIFLTFTSSIFAQSPSSFYKAKKLLYKEIYKDHNKTFYCGCSYTGKVVNLESCHYKVRKDTKRAKRVEVEHIVPAYWIAHLTEKGRACWNKGKKLKGIGGRKYCEKNNPEFKQAHNDLMNLVPSIGEINGDRSNYKFSMIGSEERQYGACDFEIYKNKKTNISVVEPSKNSRGDIARIYFYMKNKYDLEFLDETLYLMKSWDKTDPIDKWEKERIKRINLIQN